MWSALIFTSFNIFFICFSITEFPLLRDFISYPFPISISGYYTYLISFYYLFELKLYKVFLILPETILWYAFSFCY